MVNVNKIRRFFLFIVIGIGVSILFSGSTPTFSQDSIQHIESDDPIVQQSGVWTAQFSANASGGAYLFSSGSTDDVLTLNFYGTSIEILYVESPALGTFAIEIDNDIRRTVVTTSDETTFGNRAVIDYLEDEPHTLRIYLVDGVIGIDAFVTQLAPPESSRNEREEAGVIWYVTLNGSDTNTCLSDQDGCKTIQAAINKASADDIIDISGTYNEAPIIDKNLTIKGNSRLSTFIDGTGLSTSVVTINPGVTAVIEDLGIINGTAGTLTTIDSDQAYVGAGIYNQGDLTISNSQVMDNRLDFDATMAAGVGIFNHNGASLTISNSIINDNEAYNITTVDDIDKAAGAGIYNDSNATLIVSNSVIQNNRIFNETVYIIDGQGGGIFSRGSLTITDSTIFNNELLNIASAILRGGGIAIDENPGGITIANTRIIGNRAISPTDGDGAGIWLSGSIEHRDVTIVDSFFANNEAGNCCGAIFNINQTLTIINTTFTENAAVNVGAIGNGGILNIANSTISANQATNNGGAIYGEQDLGGNPPSSVTITNITNSTIVNNIADSDYDSLGRGGGVYNQSGTMTIKNSIISNNIRGDSAEDNCFSEEFLPLAGYNLVGQNGVAGGCAASGTGTILSGDINSIVEPLYIYGGFTPTHALKPSTIAVDVIPAANCTYLSSGTNPLFSNGDPITIDQRGSTRPVNTNCDIGAYEYEVDQCTLDDSIIRINVGSYGEQTEGPLINTYFGGMDLSYDGRFVAFSDSSNHLVPHDFNFASNIFRYDRITRDLIIVERPDGQLMGPSAAPSISDDGQKIIFNSIDGDIVVGDTNDRTDVFLYDLQTDTIDRVSVSSSGAEGDQLSLFGTISGDGQVVVFFSYASNLVPNDTNGVVDVFLRDLQTNITTRESLSSTGDQSNGNYPIVMPSISDNHRYIAFSSDASTLVLNDTNTTWDVFVRDRQLSETYRVSVSSTGEQANNDSYSSMLSADGRYVAFESKASNLVPDDTNNSWDVFVHDRLTGTTERVSVSSTGEQGNNHSLEFSYGIDMSADGRYIAFPSLASNLVANDTNNQMDVFIHDRQTGQTIRVTDSLRSEESNGIMYSPKLSRDGKFIAFVSGASNLVCGDTNGIEDFFLAPVTFPAYISPPTNLQATPTSPTQIDLTWSDNSSDETAFHIERSLNGTDWTEIDTVAADTTTYQDTVDCGTSYHYRVRAFRSGDGVFSTYSNTDQATSGACISENPSLIAPLNSTTTDYSALPLTFSWNEATNATWYHLVLTKGTTTVLDAWYQKGNSSMSCNGTTCQVIPNVSLSNGAYKWYIHGLTPNGNTQWTPAGNFTIQIPAPAAINKTAPANTATLSSGSVTFTWDREPNATWYQLALNGVSTWYGANAVCNVSTCSVNRTLANGTYTWYVQGYGVGGNGSWGSPFTFTIEIPKPAIINKLTPIGNQSSATPTFSWTHDPNATWYYLWIGNPTNTFYTQWVAASTACSAGTCSFNTGKTFIGNFVWYVYGYGDGGSGLWGSPTNFSYMLTLNSPSGTVSGTNITYQWSDAGSTTTYYHLWVGMNGGSTVVDQWVNASSCNGTTCSFTASGTIPNGNYIWYVQPYGPTYGNGAWSAPQSFSVSP